ncbi:MAG: hypothetical protein KF764_10205 [Labilithrix sp.]|nr:hypothetical protein [Labilithrix sp.]MBX3224417.1 hypothetical protein [Labilithrix sp.]
MSSLVTRAAMAAFVLLTACASETDGDSPPPPPAAETLFDTLPAATPNTLRGVWQTTQTASNGTVELRLRFMDRYVVGAAKCVATGSDTPVIAGGSIGLDTTALDAATGKLTIGSLGFEKQEGNIKCQGGLQANTYDFTIEDNTLTLTVGNAKLNAAFTKVGD